jgi:hypothetical protein
MAVSGHSRNSSRPQNVPTRGENKKSKGPNLFEDELHAGFQLHLVVDLEVIGRNFFSSSLTAEYNKLVFRHVFFRMV